jgi:hypothetical protein
LGVLSTNGSAQTATAQEAQKPSKKELKVLIANARTPADHEKIATHYRVEAEQLKLRQREHEKELAAYLENPSSHPSPKWPTMEQHCRQLIFYYSKTAEKALALADLHDRMAKEANQKSSPAR